VKAGERVVGVVVTFVGPPEDGVGGATLMLMILLPSDGGLGLFGGESSASIISKRGGASVSLGLSSGLPCGGGVSVIAVYINTVWERRLGKREEGGGKIPLPLLTSSRIASMILSTAEVHFDLSCGSFARKT